MNDEWQISGEEASGEGPWESRIVNDVSDASSRDKAIPLAAGKADDVPEVSSDEFSRY